MRKIKNVIIACQEILRVRKYLLMFLMIGIIFALIEIWLANYSVLSFVFRSPVFSWSNKFSILWSTIGTFFTQFELFSRITVVLTAVLIGLNSTLLIFYFKKRFALQGTTGMSLGSIVLSCVGVGCTSCGSVILSSFLGFAFTTKVLATLPFQGKEFSFMAIGILLISIYLVAQKIVNPLSCKIEVKH